MKKEPKFSREVWARIDERYAVSNYGRVASTGFYSKVRGGGRRWVKPCILRAGKSSNGYLSVCLSGEPHTVHRLVARAFIPNPFNYPCVNHKDGDRTNNFVSNLEWVSYAENERHKYEVLGFVYKRKPWGAEERKSRMAKYPKPGSRYRETPVVCVETGVKYPSMAECARQLCVHSSTVIDAVKRGYRIKGLHYVKV